ncbi:MAG: hypothetical protein QHC67_10880 [Sphingobium sp.]|uniref:hypothetical protein n=1 Tax=Sphingobium sp. TaxID=1912891 RepID=UPI0029AF36ED|nr:hypothetical protein [Sphingobium sp.]MDX3910310.1 hypothetical protein [Sphingobium sp.]
MLLWRFLDVVPLWAYAFGLCALVALSVALHRLMRPTPRPASDRPTIGILLICFAVAFILFLLGGEGRFFYANIDWQVRNAVLHDMGINPWPFVYTARGVPDVLRAPIGMFLLPALVFKAFGARAGDIALLLQNSALLTVLLGLGSQLFATSRQRIGALVVILAFSGLDAVGQLLVSRSLGDHLEPWAGIQYSSTITLAFWVPQHAFTGWICATLFLLWHTKRIPLAAFLAIVPLTALWSPFGLLGILPFAAYAGISALRQRSLRWSDVLLPGAVCLFCVPTFLYLTAAGDNVGVRFFPIEPLRYVIFQIFETAPYLIPIAFLKWRIPYGPAVFLLIALCLLVMPFIQIGWSIDFMMRASVPALTILALMVARAVFDSEVSAALRIRIYLVVALAIGAITGAFEITRAFRQPPAPLVTCTFFKAWDQSFSAYPKGSYLAPLHQMPAPIRPTNPFRASAIEPEHCWPGQWYVPLSK